MTVPRVNADTVFSGSHTPNHDASQGWPQFVRKGHNGQRSMMFNDGMRTTKRTTQSRGMSPGSGRKSSRAADRAASRPAHQVKRDRSPTHDTGIGGIELHAPSRKIKRGDLLRAVEVLNELKQRIDGEAEAAITHRGKWFLQAARTSSITKTAVWQMESVELVIRNLLQWYAVAVDGKPSRRKKTQSSKFPTK